MSQQPFIFFDLGNVIVLFDRERAVQNLLTACEEPASKVRTLLTETSPFQVDYEMGNLSNQEVYEAFCEQAKFRGTLDEFLHGISDMFELNTPILPLLSSLRSAGYSIGLLSNTCDGHWRFLEKRLTILQRYFEPLILSFEVRSMKPSPEIYRIAQANSGAPADRIVFTDDRNEHIQAARSCGWAAFQFTTPSKLANDFRHLGLLFNF